MNKYTSKYNVRMSLPSGFSIEKDKLMSGIAKDVKTVELPNGAIISGSQDIVIAMLKQLGEWDNLYLSDSQGAMFISDMATTHIKNALLKIYREWITYVSTLRGTDLVEELQTGPGDYCNFNNLLKEYDKRKDV